METTKFSPKILHVVYFDQRRNACMVENNQNHLKMSKKVPFSSCTREANVRLTKKKVCWSGIGSIVFQRTFTSFTCIAHVEKSTKTTKLQMSNQPLGVNQLLGVAPNR